MVRKLKLVPAFIAFLIILLLIYMGAAAPPMAKAAAVSAAAPMDEDQYEPNNSLETGTDITRFIDRELSASIFLANEDVDDEDWYVFRLEAQPYSIHLLAWPGLTLNAELYDPEGTLIHEDVTASGSLVKSIQPNVAGYYAIKVFSTGEAEGIYLIAINDERPVETEAQDDSEEEDADDDNDEEVAVTPITPTPLPTPDVGGTPDFAEPNWDFNVAYRIVPGDVLSGLNFAPIEINSIDNDYYTMAVRGQQDYLCRTDLLGTGLDTNMIVFDEEQAVIGGNDDIDTSNNEINSQVTFQVETDQDIFILVGYKSADLRLPGAATYTLSCTATVIEPEVETEQSLPAQESLIVAPTEPPHSFLIDGTQIQLVSQPVFDEVVEEDEPQVTLIPLLIGYDRNRDERINPEEGASGIQVNIYNSRTNELLESAVTTAGTIQFVLLTEDDLVVDIPLLGDSIVVKVGNTQPQEVLVPPVSLPPVLP